MNLPRGGNFNTDKAVSSSSSRLTQTLINKTFSDKLFSLDGKRITIAMWKVTKAVRQNVAIVKV